MAQADRPTPRSRQGPPPMDAKGAKVRRGNQPRRHELAALRKIAARVWGPKGANNVRTPQGVEALLRELARLVPAAIDNEATAAETIRGALRQGLTLRFRLLLPPGGGNPGGKTLETGVYVEGHNVTLTSLSGHGVEAWAQLVDKLAGWRTVEDRAARRDDSGRVVEWVRFAAP